MQWSEAAASVYSTATEGATGQSIGYDSPMGAPPVVPRSAAPGGGPGGYSGGSQVPSLDELADEVRPGWLGPWCRARLALVLNSSFVRRGFCGRWSTAALRGVKVEAAVVKVEAAVASVVLLRRGPTRKHSLNQTTQTRSTVFCARSEARQCCV